MIILLPLLVTLQLGQAQLEARAIPSWAGSLTVTAVQSAPPIEENVRRWTRDTVRGLRWWVRGTFRQISRSVSVWWRWLKRAAVFFALSLLAALVDRKLITAWRFEGLRALTSYAPLLIYVYLNLLFDRRTSRTGKLLLAGAVAYGLFRFDLLPDRSFVPGLFDDVVLIAAATRWFLAACPDSIVDETAARAVSWRVRAEELQRARKQTS